LTKRVMSALMSLTEDATSNKTRMELFQWALVTIGAVTTILISLKSILKEGAKGYVTVGILAVIFSAIGTACSSIIAFYTPSDGFARSERSLVQARLLHTDLSMFVASTGNVCNEMKDDADDPKMKGIKALSARLTEILNTSGAGGQPSEKLGNDKGPSTPK
jgi:hypothetical protein